MLEEEEFVVGVTRSFCTKTDADAGRFARGRPCTDVDVDAGTDGTVAGVGIGVAEDDEGIEAAGGRLCTTGGTVPDAGRSGASAGAGATVGDADASVCGRLCTNTDAGVAVGGGVAEDVGVRRDVDGERELAIDDDRCGLTARGTLALALARAPDGVGVGYTAVGGAACREFGTCRAFPLARGGTGGCSPCGCAGGSGLLSKVIGVAAVLIGVGLGRGEESSRGIGTEREPGFVCKEEETRKMRLVNTKQTYIEVRTHSNSQADKKAMEHGKGTQDCR